MKIIFRMVLLTALALLVGAAGCGQKDNGGDDGPNGKNGAGPPPGAAKTDSAPGKANDKNAPGGFGK